MKPVIIATGPSVDPRDPHAEARITEPAVVLPDDLVVKAAVCGPPCGLRWLG